MKYKTTNILILFLLVLPSLLGAQVKPDSVKIEYFRHWYPFDEEGIYFKKETFMLKDSNEGNFKIEYNKLIREVVGDTVLTNIFPIRRRGNVSIDKIEELISETSKNSIPVNISIELKNKFLKGFNYRKLKKFANEIERDWLFEYLNFKERRSIRKSIKSLSVLDTFIQNQMDYEKYTLLIVDDVNVVVVSIYLGGSEVKFKFYLDVLFSQPVMLVNEEGLVPLYNFNIKKILLDIIPRKTLLRKELDFQYDRRKYMEWFLKERM